MTQKEKSRFRYSDEWKAFRLLCKRKSGGVDYITGEPLQRGWELHHLDLSSDGYTKIGNVQDFICVNHTTHTYLHYLYTLMQDLSDEELTKKSVIILNRFADVLIDMRKRERV